MKSTERAQLLRTYGHFYTYHAPLGQKPGTCFYCGDPAGTVDHCPPLSFADALVRPDEDTRRIPFHLVPACGQCNGWLGSRAVFHLIERVEFIRDRLRTDYERRMALWSDEEIAEMSDRFARAIRARREGLDRLRDRFRFAERRALQPGAYPADD